MSYPSYPNNYSAIPIVPMHINTQQQRDLFSLLKNNFPYQIQQSNNPQVQRAMIQLKNDQVITIEQNYNAAIHPMVTINNQPYNYTSYFQWTNISNVLELVKSIQDHLIPIIKCPENPIVKEHLEFINNIHPEQDIQKIQNLSLQQIFPALQPQDYQQWLQSDNNSISSQVKEIKEYQQLKDNLLTLNQRNQILTEIVENNNNEIKDKLSTLNTKNNLMNDENSNYLQFYNRGTALSERFQDSKVLQLLYKLTEDFDNQSEYILEQGLENENGIEEQTLQYYQARKKYQRTLLLAEKFKQQKHL